MVYCPFARGSNLYRRTCTGSPVRDAASVQGVQSEVLHLKLESSLDCCSYTGSPALFNALVQGVQFVVLLLFWESTVVWIAAPVQGVQSEVLLLYIVSTLDCFSWTESSVLKCCSCTWCPLWSASPGQKVPP